MGKAIFAIGAIAGALAFSQFPDFSQQYLHDLKAQVRGLAVQVHEFDQTALRNGLTREAALLEMTGTPVLTQRQDDLRQVFLRHAQLSDNVVALHSATVLERMTMPQRLIDPETFRATWINFKPNAPFSIESLWTAGIGMLGGGICLMAIWAILRWPFRRLGWA